MSSIVLMLLAILYSLYKRGMTSIVHAQNMDRWQDFVNVVMNTHIPLKKTEFDQFLHKDSAPQNQLLVDFTDQTSQSRDSPRGNIYFGYFAPRLKNTGIWQSYKASFKTLPQRQHFFIITDILVLSKFLKITDTKLQHIN